jgi:hypothetical protein
MVVLFLVSEELHTDFHCGYTNLHSCQLCMRVHFCPHPSYHLLLFFFFNFVFLSLASINNTKGFHCGNSTHLYSLFPFPFVSPPSPFFKQCLVSFIMHAYMYVCITHPPSSPRILSFPLPFQVIPSSLPYTFLS